MKKGLIIFVAALLVLAGMALAVRSYLPTLACRMLGKAIDGTVEASKSSISFSDGLIVLKLEGMRIKGKTVEGAVGTCELRARPSKGLYVKYLVISDFALKIGSRKGHIAFFPVPVELALIRKGTVEYEGHTYTLRELRVTNFNTGGKMEFSIDGGIEGLGNLKTKGEGIFGEKRSDLKGEYELAGVDIARILKDYKGLADSRGLFRFKDGVLVMDGEVRADYFSMVEDFLKHPIVSVKNSCRIHVKRAGVETDVSLEGLSYKGTPLALSFSSVGKKLSSLELKTGFLGVDDVVDVIDPDLFAHGDWGPLSFVKNGRLRIGSFVFRRGRPIVAELEVRDVEADVGPFAFGGISGLLRVHDNALSLSGFSGRLGQGLLSEAAGFVPLTLDRDVRLKAHYAVGLKELTRLTGTESVEVTGGTTEGTIELHGREDTGFSAEGAGRLTNGGFVWRRTAFGASGKYTFGNRTVAFAPLIVTAVRTRLVVTGTAKAEQADLSLRGRIDGRQIVRLAELPYRLRGPVGVEGKINLKDDAFRAEGRIVMTDLSFEAPNVMKKGRSVKSVALVSLHGKRGGELGVDSLTYTLGPLEAAFSGTIGEGKISHVHLALDLPKTEELPQLFFFRENGVKGELKADVFVDELPYPVTKLPAMRGYVTFREGVLHPAALALPLTNINLAAIFEGDRYAVDLSNLRMGSSVLSEGHLTVDGLSAPHFTLAVDMDSFDPGDFSGIFRKQLRLPVILPGSLADRTTGEFLLESKSVRATNVDLKDVLVRGSFGGRTLAVHEGGAAVGRGNLTLQGDAYLGPVATIHARARLSHATAQEFLAFLGEKHGIVEGVGSISADLSFAGNDGDQLARSASGTVNLASRDGVIRKWVILSKILAFTNLSDLVRGRVDLTRQGLVYRRFNASFHGRDGVFHTDNLLIDSPSMLITGTGDVDAAAKEMDGELIISPLVTLDRIINVIPIVRRIVREGKSGFLFFGYHLKGPLDDPEVESSYVRSVGARIFYLLRNAVELPKGLWDSFQKERQR